MLMLCLVEVGWDVRCEIKPIYKVVYFQRFVSIKFDILDDKNIAIETHHIL